MRILVDADACPVAIKDILFRAADRVCIKTYFVANQPLQIPDSEWVEFVLVRPGMNRADDRIVEMVHKGDLVITGDIPLASRAIAEGAHAIGTRGEIYNSENIRDRRIVRSMTERFRTASDETFGPKPMHIRDRKRFANQLDRLLTKLLRKKRKRLPGTDSSSSPQSPSSENQSLT